MATHLPAYTLVYVALSLLGFCPAWSLWEASWRVPASAAGSRSSWRRPC
jgi:hypothetical protein